MPSNESLFKYCLRIADNNLILGHRLSEWCGHGPMLEEDLAMTNISLDMLGQANSILQYAAKIESAGRNEDDLAFMRHERQFYNALICELPVGDFAFTIVRQFLVDTYDYYFFQALQSSADTTLAALAAKGLKEVTYHKRHSSTWLERLGDGTEESHARAQSALDQLWGYTGELFEMTDLDNELLKDGISVDLANVKSQWLADVNEMMTRATLTIPEGVWQHSGGRNGVHTEHLGFLLAEMQSTHREFPGVTW